MKATIALSQPGRTIKRKASSSFYVVINPLGFAASIPQLRGIPFWYPQYRATIGLEFYAG